MSVVPSLLQAMVQLNGEAVVMHVGDKPYVVSPTGQVDLATRGLTLDAVSGIVGQLLPPELMSALDEIGAAQYELPELPQFPGEQFTIVVARGGDDVWAEIRRRRRPHDEDHVPVELLAPAAPSVPPVVEARREQAVHRQAPAPASRTEPAPRTAPPPAMGPAVRTEPTPPPQQDDDLPLPNSSALWPGRRGAALEEGDLGDAALRAALIPPPPRTPPPSAPAAPPREVPTAMAPPPAALSPPPYEPRPAPAPVAPPPSPILQPPRVAPVSAPTPPPPRPAPVMPLPAPQPVVPPAVSAIPTPAPRPVVPPSVPRPVLPPPAPPVAAWTPPAEAVAAFPPPAAQPAVVLPLTRNPVLADVPARLPEQTLSGLDRLLRLAAARGGSTLYLSSGARPSVRVDGDVQILDGVPELSPNDIESLLLTLMPERSAEALRTGVASEWLYDVPELGRVRCMSFRDHRGPGGVFRMMPVRVISAEQLGLPREIQSLAIEPEGLVLVAGPRSSGKRTLMSALVDLVNRTRRDHVITVETEIKMVHEVSGSFISQREVRGGRDEMLTVARAALREDPDVLMLEDVRSAELMSLSLDAAASGQLVIGGFPASSASGAIDRIIDLYPPEYRRQVQLSLAQNVRGVVAQVLLRKNGGGRVAAREVLLSTPTVRSVLAEGKTSQLPMAIEGGRVHGMRPLNDALVAFVQSGTVDVREAYRRAADRAGFLELLKRQGVDTAPIERYA